MTIWVDADACPKVIKEILYRAAERGVIKIIFIANQFLRLPQSDFLEFVLVAQGADLADDEIAARCQPSDLVVTADIPLAARVVEKGAVALNPNGKLYGPENIKEILSMRDFMDSLRGSGIETGGDHGFGQRERQNFANALDRFMTQAQAQT